ncbi:hypothetical protein BOSE62_190047 [Bosea sp. 62]|nr:hypothetical protein BOSE21B_150006 [Bosea sp. 21B]CAD5291962.1 hypothetical protein BOSE46_70655 [Bosea sp. 46]CAD5300623.1 hypothetical protein BOSE7B_90033 [Bosea sp. 7B]VVT60773.1 hypothetical protein BOS5A_230050 [Bosea sp. EC-HK365B]VXC05668.1 hypothetical protein BOSE62_190047 [Bosea sp. 62]VXC59189.1 hypothetical protein BOSE127_230006 [Bosea sp. 127]VXC67255.1 hypothetical protein BOSE29B_50624 [Bosea sp. 29B]
MLSKCRDTAVPFSVRSSRRTH